MAEYLAPGVYVEEVDTGSKPIEGVSTSTAGVVGVTERGPENVPTLVTSMGEYTQLFGGQLPVAEFHRHAYLPHAIEGFFSNGGKRVYVTRVAPDAARRAATSLFDRGDVAAMPTVLLRAAPESRGSVPAAPLLYALSSAGLASGDFVRIGDGSGAEYLQVDSVGAATHVSLDFPLARAHNAGEAVESFPRTALGGITTFFTLSLAAASGETALDVASAAATPAAKAADAAALIAGVLVEIADAANPALREYRLVATAGLTGAGNVHITLDSPLTLSYPVGAHVTALDIAVATANATTLETSTGPGETLLFRNASAGFAPGVLVRIKQSGVVNEVRRATTLTQLTLDTPAATLYPTGALIDQVTLQESVRTLSAVSMASNSVTLVPGGVAGLVPGQQVLLNHAPSLPATLTIRTIVGNVVTFTTAIPAPAPVVATDRLLPAPKALTDDARPGSSVLRLDDRLGLVANQLLRIGTGADAEYVTAASLPSRADAGSDAGTVILSHALTRAHPAGTPVTFVVVAPTATAAAALTLSLPEGSVSPVVVSESTGVVAGGFVRIRIGDALYFHRVAQAGAAAGAAPVALRQPTRRAHPRGASLIERVPLLDVEALDRGGWGNRLRLSVQDEESGLLAQTTFQTRVDAQTIRLASPAGVEPGTILEFRDAAGNVVGPLQKVIAVDRANNNALRLAAALDPAQVEGLFVRSREFRLSVFWLRRPDPLLPTRDSMVVGAETFRYLSLDSRHSRYAVSVLGAIDGPARLSDHRPEGESSLVRLRDRGVDDAARHAIRLGPETLVDILPTGRVQSARHPLFDGADSADTVDDGVYIGADAVNPADRTGLFSLASIDDISIVAIPGQTSAAVQNQLIIHCENLRYRFAVLDGPAPPGDGIAEVEAQRQQYDTKYAALYYPWATIPDPFPTNLASIAEFPIPPSGHMLGVYARTDIERGVHKAPANEVVRGIVGLRRKLNKGHQDILNPFPVNINVIRDFRADSRGIRSYGGRVITSDPDYKYVNVRRLMIYIEHSLDRGLQWVVFEPNAEPLWARVRRSISNFLKGVWRDGALEGTTKEEAYFVKCDRTTMTQTDIDNGRLIVQIGVAPVKPAEFVIIRLGLWTAHGDD